MSVLTISGSPQQNSQSHHLLDFATHLLAAQGIPTESINVHDLPAGDLLITPTSQNLRDSLANFNLTSIVVTREAVGTAILDISFANPTNTLFFWERGSAAVQGNSDILVEMLDSLDLVTGAYKIVRSNYTATNTLISTWNGSFSSPATPSGANPVLG